MHEFLKIQINKKNVCGFDYEIWFIKLLYFRQSSLTLLTTQKMHEIQHVLITIWYLPVQCCLENKYVCGGKMKERQISL